MDNMDKLKELAGKMKKRLFFDMDNVLVVSNQDLTGLMKKPRTSTGQKGLVKKTGWTRFPGCLA